MTVEAERRSALDESIERLYKVFRSYKFTDTRGDPAFPNFSDLEPLLAAPLRELPASAFQYYAWKCVSSWGTADDFRHFLPRLLELCATCQQSTEIHEVGEWLSFPRFYVFGKLPYAGWLKWPKREREAIEDYYTCLWSWVLSTPASSEHELWYSWTPEYWLDDLSQGLDVRSLLEAWKDDCQDAANGFNAACHIATFAASTAITFPNADSLSSKCKSQSLEIVAWLKEVDLPAIIEPHFFAQSESPHAKRMSDALMIYENWVTR